MTNGPQPSPFLQGRLDLAYLKQFFNWCVRNKHLRENPADGIQIDVDRGTPEFFTVKQSQELMKKAQEKCSVGPISDLRAAISGGKGEIHGQQPVGD